MSNQRIVCAALRLKDGLIVCGPRHFDRVMRTELDAAYGDQLDARIAGAQQGFVDQFGRFLSREDAFQIAKENGQIIRSLGAVGDKLYSEHLY